MSLFYTLLFGGFLVGAWRRLGRLERQVADLARQLDAVRDASRPIAAAPFAAPPVAEAVAEAAEALPDLEPATTAPSPPSPVPEDLQTPAAAPYESAPDAVTTPAKARRGFSFDFEDIFGRRLPIWGGGFALAIAGIFLVRFSIEAGLLTPLVRVAMSFIFGLSLLAGAEAAFRFDARLADPRVRQALAGAGLATLYGAFYLAGTSYGLIGAGGAFIGLASVTAVAIGLSFRFGLPSAVIGLVGGFAAPLLVDSDSANVPLLSFYLALICGGLTWSGQTQGRRWLSYAALAAGLGWGALMMLTGVSSTSDFAALGVYLVVLGTVLPAFLHAKGGPRLPHLAAGALAALQMAVLVSNAGFVPLTWGLYLLIAAALSGLGWRFEMLRPGTLVAAGLGLWLLIIWPDPDARFFALVAAVQVAIFAGVPLAHQLRSRTGLLDLAQLGAVSLIVAGAAYVRYGSWSADESEPLLAAVCAGLALLPAAAFALLWRRGQEARTRDVLVVLAPAALLAFAALLLMSQAWLAPVMAAIVSAPLLWCHARRDAVALHGAAWAGAALTLLALAATPGFENEFTQLGDLALPAESLRAIVRWAAAAAPFAAVALIARTLTPRHVAEVFTVGLGYGLLAQVLPSAALAWAAAVGAMALFMTQPARVAAWTAALVIAAAWSTVPLASWVTAGMLALTGAPFMATSVVPPADLILRIAPLWTAIAALWWSGQTLRREIRAAALLGLGIIGAVVLHSLYKQIFGITSLSQFEHYGMAERSTWQGLLVATAFAVRQRLAVEARRPVILGLVAAALAHFGVFTLILHNPLLSVQHVGPTPIANWLTPAYLIAIAAVWHVQSQWDNIPAAVRTAGEAAKMTLIALLAYSLLRHAFAGSVLTASTVGQTESLLISLLGIVLELGFLVWGSWRAARSWRIGSLVLMLVAVIKVFLIDAAGLEGLLRIASFMALGFSLIGIGWVYSRQLSQAKGGQDTTQG